MKKILFFLLLFSTSFFFNPSLAQENCLQFDGVDDQVRVKNRSVINPTGGLTVEAWINATTWKSQQWEGTIVGKDTDPKQGYVLRCGSNGKLSFVIGDGTNWPEAVSASLMQTNTWYHVAGVFDGTSLKIYINGEEVGSTAANSINPSSTPLYIGASAGFGGRHFHGKIDEVRVWKRGRTQTEIQNYMNADLQGDETNLVAYYNFNQASGDSLPTLTSDKNLDGVLENFGGSPWVSGYVSLGTDLRMDAALSPDPINFFKGASRVKVRMNNVGIDTINQIILGYTYNNFPMVVDTVDVNIKPSEFYTYAFDEVLDIPWNNNLVRVFAKVDGDINITNDSLEIPIIKPTAGNENRIVLFDKKQHNFAGAGQSHLAKVQLPDNVEEFQQILMDIQLDCPFTGCDPWDQPAKISVIKDGKSFEVARFITPYGKGCGPWTVDITDFKSILTGGTTFESYIQVWGNSGWLLDVSLRYVDGRDSLPYQKLTALWNTDNWVYGDPAISYDLPAQTQTLTANTQASKVRMTISGHGQGNTDNAAEFSPRVHQFFINDQADSSHSLWKADCAQNTCDNQAGTWLFARAGWCPGQEVQPFELSLDQATQAGQALKIDYELEAYTNLLNTGYDGAGHTEPHYKIHAYLIEKSAQYIQSDSFINMAAKRIVSPTSMAETGPQTSITAVIYNAGNEPVVDPWVHYFFDGQKIASEQVSATLQPQDSLVYTFSQTADMDAIGYSLSVLVDAAGDGTAGDDVATARFGWVTDLEDEFPTHEIQVYPNPSQITRPC